MSVMRKNGICRTYSAIKSSAFNKLSSHVTASREIKIDRNHSAAFTKRICNGFLAFVVALDPVDTHGDGDNQPNRYACNDGISCLSVMLVGEDGRVL